MKLIIRKFFVTALSLHILTLIVPSINIESGLDGYLVSSFIMMLLMFLAKPVINLVLFPINILTLNLFQWIVNIFIFYIWTILSYPVKISTWEFSGLNMGLFAVNGQIFALWQTIFISSIIFNLLLIFIDWLNK